MTERSVADTNGSAPLTVTSDGAVRIVTLNRPADLNAVNWELDEAIASVFTSVSDDAAARAIVLTGAGRAFCAGGDIGYIDRLREDRALRQASLDNGKRLVHSMIRCRVPIVAAVNGPAVGLGCSLMALSDMVFMAESAYVSDPHVALGLVAGDGGPIAWPAHVSLLLAKQYLLTGDRIPASKAEQMGLVNCVVGDDEVVDKAMAWAQRVAAMPQQAVEDTKRLLNLHLERDVLAGMDFAFSAESRSFDSDELAANVQRFLDRRKERQG